MSRVAVWILGTISGIILAFGILASTSFGYGASSSCVSYGPNPQPCTPVLQQVHVFNPLAAGSASSGLVIVLLAVLIGLPAWIGSAVLAQRRGSSSRTAILIVAIIACAVGIAGVVSVLLVSPALTTPETCINSTQFCYYGVQAKVLAVLGIGLGPVLASLLIGMPAWVMALTETATRRRWGWFFPILFFSPLAAMLYGFLGAPTPAAAPPSPAAALATEDV